MLSRFHSFINYDNVCFQPGMILTGFAKKKVSYGLFVETNGLVGLVLNKVRASTVRLK